MSDESPRDEYRRPTWDEVRRRQIESEERRRRFEAKWAEQMARLDAAIEVVKRNEALMARRRCWLF